MENVDFEKGLDWTNETLIYVNQNKGKAKVTLSIRNFPKNCGECAFYNRNSSYDDEAFFGSGFFKACPFGAEARGCLVKRPPNCPLISVD